MAVNLPPLGDLAPVPGVRLGTACAGIKQRHRDDVAIIELAAGARVAGVFTQNRFRAPPVALAEARIQSGSPRALLINSGNANAATGAPGFNDAIALCRQVAECCTGLSAKEVLPFSTGVIGERLPVAAMAGAIKQAAAKLRADAWPQVARAIMTTDTGPKAVSRQTLLDGAPVTLTGIAKGAGMIRPDMATMLAFICCDAKVALPALQSLAQITADGSFNRITVDGDTSTNDAFVICATGMAHHPEIRGPGNDFDSLRSGLAQVSGALAERIVRDAEGATKLVRIQVAGGADEEECLKVAYTLAESPLVKTALFAGDPNWGRFCMAIGRAGITDLDPRRVSLTLDGAPIALNGLVAEDYDETAAAATMAKSEFSIEVDLGRGRCAETVLTSDLSYDYVRINAEYRS